MEPDRDRAKPILPAEGQTVAKTFYVDGLELLGFSESMMKDVAWQLEYSVETSATLSFAWRYLTDVRNWKDPPAEFALDGPFAAGSQGTTLLPGVEPVRWRISDVQPGRSYTLEAGLERATLSFEWCFDAVSDRRTRLTQRIVLTGDNAAAYAQQVEASFGPNLRGGMASTSPITNERPSGVAWSGA